MPYISSQVRPGAGPHLPEIWVQAGEAIYLPDALAAEVKAELTDTNISAACQAALRIELEREKAMQKIDADGYQRVVLYDGKRNTTSRSKAARSTAARRPTRG